MDIFITILLATANIGIIYFCLELKRIDKQNELRLKEHQEWLFESLYAMDGRVLKPYEKIEVVNDEAGRVYSPTKDALKILKGEV